MTAKGIDACIAQILDRKRAGKAVSITPVENAWADRVIALERLLEAEKRRAAEQPLLELGPSERERVDGLVAKVRRGEFIGINTCGDWLAMRIVELEAQLEQLANIRRTLAAALMLQPLVGADRNARAAAVRGAVNWADLLLAELERGAK